MRGDMTDKYRQEVRDALKGMTPRELKHLSMIITELKDEVVKPTKKRK